MIRKREPRWQSAAERARVASELIEEAESLTETNTSASSADGRRDSLPQQAELPADAAAPSPPAPAAPAPPAPATAGSAPAQPMPIDLDRALAADPDDVGLLVERAKRLAAGSHYAAARRDLERAVELEPGNGKALYGLGIVLDRLNRPDEATLVYRRSRETGGR